MRESRSYVHDVLQMIPNSENNLINDRLICFICLRIWWILGTLWSYCCDHRGGFVDFQEHLATWHWWPVDTWTNLANQHPQGRELPNLTAGDSVLEVIPKDLLVTAARIHRSSPFFRGNSYFRKVNGFELIDIYWPIGHSSIALGWLVAGSVSWLAAWLPSWLYGRLLVGHVVGEFVGWSVGC